jgi:hypothetical protein
VRLAKEVAMTGKPTGRSRRCIAAPLLLLVGALILVAAGCGGGSSSDAKANEAYAGSVCTAVSGWEQQIKTIATTFTGRPSKATLETKVTQAKTATKTLVSDIKAIPVPDTSEAQAAKQQLDQLSTDATATVDAAKSAVTQIKADPSAGDISLAVAALAPQVKNLASEAKSAITSLKDAKGSLSTAFKNADSCQSLG